MAIKRRSIHKKRGGRSLGKTHKHGKKGKRRSVYKGGKKRGRKSKKKICGGFLLSAKTNIYKPLVTFNGSDPYKSTPLKKNNRPSALNLDLPLLLVGSDIEQDRINDTEANLKEAGLQGTHHALNLGDICSKEFGQKSAREIFSNSQIVAWCMMNPPYGKRIKQPVDHFDLLETLSNWGPWQRIGVLLPQAQKLKKLPKGVKLISSLQFENGGEKVSYFLYEKELSK